MSRQPDRGEVTEEERERKRLRMQARLNDPWGRIMRKYVETQKMWDEDDDVGHGEGCKNPLRREVFRVQRQCDENPILFARLLRASMKQGIAGYRKHMAEMMEIQESQEVQESQESLREVIEVQESQEAAPIQADDPYFFGEPGCNAPPNAESP